MTHEQTLDLLDDYVGGELPPREERDVRRHLMQCDECRAEELALRMLLDEAAALPELLDPPSDLWQGIAPRLESRAPAPAERLDEVRVIGPRPVRPLPWWMLAAASVALVVTTSFATLRFSDNGDTDTVLPAQQAQAPARTAGTPTALASFAPAEQEYEKAIGDLQTVLQQHRDQLAPETVAALEANLRIIDKAIQESRAALAKDPYSPELAQMLTDAYGAKLNVLRRAVSL
jgi:anti-sigma factor RsiW